MAMENPATIQADGVEAMEFQDRVEQFKASGVPQITINFCAGAVVWAVPEVNLLDKTQRIAA